MRAPEPRLLGAVLAVGVADRGPIAEEFLELIAASTSALSKNGSIC